MLLNVNVVQLLLDVEKWKRIIIGICIFASQKRRLYENNIMEKEEILKNAHQEYVDWWLPIDVAGGSFLAPMFI
jgi:hypothetical protein